MVVLLLLLFLSFQLKMSAVYAMEMWKFNEKLLVLCRVFTVKKMERTERTSEWVSETVCYSMSQHFIVWRNYWRQHLFQMHFVYIYIYIYTMCWTSKPANNTSWSETRTEKKKLKRKVRCPFFHVISNHINRQQVKQPFSTSYIL